MVGGHRQNIICDQFSAFSKRLLFMVFIQLERAEQIGFEVLTAVAVAVLSSWT
jgi:hypothetical protein